MWDISIKEILSKFRCWINSSCMYNLDTELTEDDLITFCIYAIEGETDLTRNRNEYKTNFDEKLSNINI